MMLIQPRNAPPSRGMTYTAEESAAAGCPGHAGAADKATAAAAIAPAGGCPFGSSSGVAGAEKSSVTAAAKEVVSIARV